MSGLTIYPTHRCFDDALEFIGELLTRERASMDLPVGVEMPRQAIDQFNARFKLVHGVCVLDDRRYAHAWVEERREIVYDFGLLHGAKVVYSCLMAEYYENRRVVETTKYSAEEAWEQNKVSGNYGPWNPDYLALCRNRGRD